MFDGIMKEVEGNIRRTELLDGAMATYEIYVAYVEAGFTEEQALKIVIDLVTNMTNNGGGVLND